MWHLMDSHNVCHYLLNFQFLKLILSLSIWYGDGMSTNTRCFTMSHCDLMHRYISTHFHLILFAPLVLIPLKSGARRGLPIAVTVWALSLFIPFFTRFVVNVPTLFELFKTSSFVKHKLIFTYSYYGAWNYIFPFMTGILFGYAIEKYQKIDKIGPNVRKMTTIVIFVAYLVYLYWKRHFYQPDYPFDGFYGYELHIFLVVHKPILMSFYCWIIYSCISGHLSKYYSIQIYIICWNFFTIVESLILLLLRIDYLWDLYPNSVCSNWIDWINFS